LGAGLALDDVRPDEAEAGRGAAEDADDGAVLAGGADDVVLAQLHAPLADQLAEGVAELAVELLRQAQPAGPRPRLEGRVRLATDRGQDLLSKVGHRRRSPRCFPRAGVTDRPGVILRAGGPGRGAGRSDRAFRTAMTILPAAGRPRPVTSRKSVVDRRR